VDGVRVKMNDIIERLAELSDLMMNDQPYNDSDFTDIDEAICEIRRLREERETYFNAHDALLAQTIELRSQRDEARREVCDLKTFNFENTISAYRYADLRKWDCYKENTNG